MSEKLDRILEYCDLETRLQHGTGLNATERARLDRLRDQMSPGVPSLDERDPYTLLSEPLPAQVITGSRVMTGMLRNVSASGVALSVDAQPPSLSERARVVARDAQHGLEYAFVGTVVSRVVKGTFGMALQLESVPSRLRLGGRSGVFPRGGLAEPATVRPPDAAGSRAKKT